MPRLHANGDCAELVLTRDRARELGFGDTRIDTLLRSGRWRAPFPGILVTTPVLGLTTRCRAAVLYRGGQGVLSHSTAARLWHLPDIPRPATIELSLPPPRTQRQPRGLTLHWPHLDDVDVARVDGLPCTSAARTIADIGRDPRLRTWVVVLADSALGQGLVTPEDLLGAADRIARRADRPTIRRALAAADGRSRSPQESRVRVIVTDAGLPAPEPNWTLRDGDGSVVAIGDLVYPDLLLWFEYDGVEVHSSPSAFQADRLRERRIRSYGFEVVHLVGADLHDPQRLVELVRRQVAGAPERISRLPAHLGPFVVRAQTLLWSRTRPAS